MKCVHCGREIKRLGPDTWVHLDNLRLNCDLLAEPAGIEPGQRRRGRAAQ